MLSKDEIIERLDDVFRDVFDDDTLEVDENTAADDIEDWDSIEHITLIGAVEDEFKMRFKMGEVSGMKDVGEMIGIIEQNMRENAVLFLNFVVSSGGMAERLYCRKLLM